jgi:hypothetical protein
MTLARVAGVGQPAIYLETATPANRAYCERRGYLVEEERALTATTTLWSLLKVPPSAGPRRQARGDRAEYDL